MGRFLANTCIILMFCLMAKESIGQGADQPIANKGYYRSFNSAGGYLHTLGLGMFYRHGWRLTGFSNHLINFEISSLHDKKEYKISTPGSQTRGYFYGKINSAGLVRASYGWQKTLFDKEVKRGVRVSHFILLGPTFALVKPVYVQLNRINEGGDAELIKYSTAVHNQGEVIGRGPVLYKLNSTKIYPGGHIKYSLNFEYSSDDSYIRAIETGACLDVFAKQLPIMENNYNDPIFLTLYVSFNFGKRSL
jgi:hypothetical protein